jgi:hypothetical protein
VENGKPPKSPFGESGRFSTNYGSQVKLCIPHTANKGTEKCQQTPVLMKHESQQLKSFTVKAQKNKRKPFLLGSSRGTETDSASPVQVVDDAGKQDQATAMLETTFIQSDVCFI